MNKFKVGDRAVIKKRCYDCNIRLDHTGMHGTIIDFECYTNGIIKDGKSIRVVYDEGVKYDNHEGSKLNKAWYHWGNCLELEHKGFDPEDIISKAFGGEV